MKKFASLFLSITMLLVLSACSMDSSSTAPAPAPEESASVADATSEEPEEPAEEATGSDNKVIAGIVFQEDQFFKLLSAGYAAAAADNGYEIKLANTNNEQAKETETVNTYTAEGIAGIAISPLSVDVSVAALQEASDAGLSISVCNAPIESFPFAVGTYTSDDVAFCKQTGQAAAEFINANLDGTAKVGIIQYKTQVPEQSTNRVNGFLEGLDEAGIDYEIVADQDAWLQDMAIEKAGDMLAANPDIDVIFCANEGGTVGTTMAVANAGLGGSTFVFGTDSSEQIVDLLKDDNNVLQAVTGQDPFAIGYQTVLALIEDIEGKPVTGAGQTNIVDGVPLARGNNDLLDAFLEDLQSKM